MENGHLLNLLYRESTLRATVPGAPALQHPLSQFPPDRCPHPLLGVALQVQSAYAVRSPRPTLLSCLVLAHLSFLLFPASLLLGSQSHPKAVTSLSPGTTIILAKDPRLWPCLYRSRQSGRDFQLPFLSHLLPCPPHRQPERRW